MSGYVHARTYPDMASYMKTNELKMEKLIKKGKLDHVILTVGVHKRHRDGSGNSYCRLLQTAITTSLD